MDDSNVASRLKGFIDSQGLTHSQFSDKCGIPRPSLSQILSGRNKKISDVIAGQIHKAFPELSILWLLFGEGEMLQPATTAVPNDGNDIRQDRFPSGFGTSGSLFDDDELEMSDDGVMKVIKNRNDSGSSRKSGSDKPEFTTVNKQNVVRSNVSGLTAYSDSLKDAEKQIVDYEKKLSELQLQIEKLRANPRKVSHITVYYDDSTFETFFPQR